LPVCGNKRIFLFYTNAYKHVFASTHASCLISLHCATTNFCSSVYFFFSVCVCVFFLFLQFPAFVADKRFISLSFCRRQLQMPRKLNMLPFWVGTNPPTPSTPLGSPCPQFDFLPLSLDKRHNSRNFSYIFGFLNARMVVGLLARWAVGHPVIKHPLISCFYLHIHAAHSQLNWQPDCLPASLPVLP